METSRDLSPPNEVIVIICLKLGSKIQNEECSIANNSETTKALKLRILSSSLPFCRLEITSSNFVPLTQLIWTSWNFSTQQQSTFVGRRKTKWVNKNLCTLLVTKCLTCWEFEIAILGKMTFSQVLFEVRVGVEQCNSPIILTRWTRCTSNPRRKSWQRLEVSFSFSSPSQDAEQVNIEQSGGPFFSWSSFCFKKIFISIL